MLTIGSLCSGYGGLDMAVAEVLDARVAWVADPDPGASAVLAHHHPDAPNLGDITATDWDAVDSVDILTAGYPCQPFSLSGQRKGTTDERHIWPNVAEAIRLLRPGFVFLENVAGHRSLGFGRVLADLASFGYVGSWVSVRASDVGASHRRERVFIGARPADASCERFQGARLRGRSSVGGRVAADTDRLGVNGCGPDGRPAERHSSCAGGSAADTASVREREPADQAVAVARGGEARLELGGRSLLATADAEGDGRDERRPEPAGQQGRPDAAVGSGAASDPHSDAVREQPVAVARRGGATVLGRSDTAAANASGLRDQDGTEHDHRQFVLAEPGPGGRADGGCGSSGTGRDRNAAAVVEWGPYGPAVRRWEAAIGRPAPDPTELNSKGGRRLSPTFVEWMMGLPAGHVTDVPGLTRNQQLKLLGNGVVPRQGAAALELLLARAFAGAGVKAGA